MDYGKFVKSYKVSTLASQIQNAKLQLGLFSAFGVLSRAVKTLENVTLVLASKFENFRELPSIDSRNIFCPHSQLKFREFLRISRESSKILEVIFSQGCRNRGGGHLSTTPPHIFSKECENRGHLRKPLRPLVFSN